MKKYIAILAFGLFGIQVLSAQSPVEIDSVIVYEYEPVRNVVKISPFHFIEGTFMLGYERFWGDNSLLLMAGLHSRERYFQSEPEFGFQEEIQFRHYFASPRNTGSRGRNFFFFKGLYAGPYLYHRYRQQTVQVWDWVAQENVEVPQDLNEVAGGVVVGAQIAFSNVVYLDFYTGGGIKRSFGRNPNVGFLNITSPGYNGVLPKIGFLLGIAF